MSRGPAPPPVPDAKDEALLVALQRDARAPLKALAQTCGLSVAATAERVKRLEARGWISGYHACVEAGGIGLAVEAVVGIAVPPPHRSGFFALLESLPAVVECQHVSGAEAYVLRVAVPDTPALQALLDLLSPYGPARSAIVLSTPIPRRPLRRAP